MRRRRSALAALLLLSACSAGGEAPPPAPSPHPVAPEQSPDIVSAARLARLFDELAYGNPASPEGTSPNLVRWASRSLTYAVVGSAPPGAERRISERLQRFQALTGVAATPSKEPAATLVFEFVRGTHVPVRDELAACSTRTTYDAGGIRLARIFIATEPARTFSACLDHELMHAYGFPHHSSVLPSVMGPIRMGDTLSEADEAVLRALYDPRLSVGMTREQAAPILARIFDEAARTRPISSRQLGADLEWRTIAPQETVLAFDPPGLARAIGRSFRATPPDGGYLVEISFLSAPEQEWPRASARYLRLGRDRGFSRLVTPEEIARSWPTVMELRPRFRTATERQTPIGLARYAISDTAAGPCLVFVAELGGERSARVDGFYCAASGQSLDPAAILERLRLRDPRYRIEGGVDPLSASGGAGAVPHPALASRPSA